MNNYIYTDINIRLADISSNDVFTITDTKAVHQSLEKLINTSIGEIPNFRAFGVNLKRFLQYPLNNSTGQAIYSHVSGQVKKFIKTVTVLDEMSNMILDVDNGVIKIQIAVKCNDTGEIIVLPLIDVAVNG